MDAARARGKGTLHDPGQWPSARGDLAMAPLMGGTAILLSFSIPPATIPGLLTQTVFLVVYRP